jgi:hypothetical protein
MIGDTSDPQSLRFGDRIENATQATVRHPTKQQIMANGERRTENGEWRVEKRELGVDGGEQKWRRGNMWEGEATAE